MTEKPYTVFISAAQRDTELVRDLSERIKQVGDVRVLLAEQVTSSETATSQIRRMLENSDEVVMLVTESAIHYQHTLAYEVGISEGLGKLITPIVVNVEETRIPDVLADFPFVRWSSIPSYIQKLEQRIQNGLSVKAETKSASKAERKSTRKGEA